MRIYWIKKMFVYLVILLLFIGITFCIYVMAEAANFKYFRITVTGKPLFKNILDCLLIVKYRIIGCKAIATWV